MFSRSLGSYSCFPLPSWEGFEKLISAFGSLPEVEMQPLDLRKHCPEFTSSGAPGSRDLPSFLITALIVVTGVDDALGHSRLEMAPEIPNSNASGITLGMWGNARSHHSWLAAYNKKMKRRLEGEVSPSQGRCRDGGLAFI